MPTVTVPEHNAGAAVAGAEQDLVDASIPLVERIRTDLCQQCPDPLAVDRDITIVIIVGGAVVVLLVVSLPLLPIVAALLGNRRFVPQDPGDCNRNGVAVWIGHPEGAKST